ncbi:MAG: MFS transporter [Candidatus Acidiferrum sp.]|jgi:ACS family tartrate transporter-like MFS transporter
MILLIMGVAGSGKSTVGSQLAVQLGWTSLDADDFHSPENKAKMRRGIHLTEDDRIPWLQAMHAELVRLDGQKENAVLACSALKKSYREILAAGLDLRVVYLKGSYEVIQQRIQERHAHFAGTSILADQFAMLEEPGDALDLDVTLSAKELVAKMLAHYGLSPCASASSGDAVIHRLLWRLLPFLFLLYVVAYLDRINVGFAALQMQSQLKFSDAVYGLGAGIFFLGYFLFQVPSNMAMQKFGARRWIAFLMILWGGISASMMFVGSARSFYTMRFLLGAAEAGFFPGVIYYLRNWFPAAVRARALALFIMAGPISGVIGGPISGALLGFHRRAGLAGWQWLFLLEGIPAILLGFVAYFFLTDRPEKARWLSADDLAWLVSALRSDEIAASKERAAPAGILSMLMNVRVWGFSFIYFSAVACAYSIGLWLPTAVRALSGISPFVIGLLAAIPYLAAAIAMVIVGAHSDRTGERDWHVALPAFITCFALAAAAFATTVPATVAAFTIAMAAEFSMMGPFWVLASGTLDAKTAAAGIAFINAIGNLGSGLGPYWIGYLRTLTGSFRGGLLSIAVLLFLAGFTVLGIRQTRVTRTVNS